MRDFIKTFGLLLLVGACGLPFWLARHPTIRNTELIVEPGDTEWAELNDGRVPYERPAWRPGARHP